MSEKSSIQMDGFSESQKIAYLSSIPRIEISEKRLTVIIAKDEDGYCAHCPELDLVTELDSPELALIDIKEAMRDYAEQYLAEIELYKQSTNRAHHLPYVCAIAACKTDWELNMLLEVRYGAVHF